MSSVVDILIGILMTKNETYSMKSDVKPKNQGLYSG